MNPSANGWIKKLISVLDKSNEILDLESLYPKLRACGFIYGNNVSIVNDSIEKNDLSVEEISKINLAIAFYVCHNEVKSDVQFTDSVNAFYKKINAYQSSIFSELLSSNSSSEALEKTIHKRIQIDDNFIDKSFNYFIINALLFIDVLGYKHYLKTGEISIEEIKEKEATIETLTLSALNSKIEKTEYDQSLIQLFEQSLRYQGDTNLMYDEAVKLISNRIQALYVLDLSAMAMWSDTKIDENESSFLKKLGANLDLSPYDITTAVRSIQIFHHHYKDEIVIFGSKNVVKVFYNNSSNMVSKLLSRNSKRLIKELNESKELMILITQSTFRDLSKEEQKKVQGQLLDIFKSIPSLAIFLLPGGALLLPFVIKFIPKLLPSAFDDNRIDENE